MEITIATLLVHVLHNHVYYMKEATLSGFRTAAEFPSLYLNETRYAFCTDTSCPFDFLDFGAVDSIGRPKKSTGG